MTATSATPAKAMPSEDILQVHCACPDQELALRLARGAVEQGLAACVQLIPGVISIYRWEGAIEQSAEVLCLFKTTTAAFPALDAFIRAQHTYTTPEILVFAAALAGTDYAAWLRACVKA